jgi:hypothetical protein
MPNAVSNSAETVRRELKTCLEGYIVARRLTYGEKLQRRAMTSGMKIAGAKGKKDFEGEMQLISEQATIFDFQNCIVDHNLEDADGRKLALGTLVDVRKLDPRIGEEIDQFLSEINNFEEDEGN